MNFYKKTLITAAAFGLLLQWQSADAAEAGSSKAWAKVGVSMRSVEHNKKNDKTKVSVEPLGMVGKAGASFNFAEDHSVGVGLSYYTVSEADVETKEENKAAVKSEDKYERAELSVHVKYNGSLALSDMLKLKFGVYSVAWKFKMGDNNMNSALYSSVLNHSYNQAATVQLTPYVGIGIQAGDSGMVTLKAAWNHYLFQNSEIDLSTEDKTTLSEKSYEVEGGHSMAAKLKYSHKFGPLKVAAWVKYVQTMVDRSAKLIEDPKAENEAKVQKATYEDVSGMNVAVAGKAMYSVSDALAVKAWVAYDVLSELEYKMKANKDATAEDHEATDVSLSGGLAIAYMF